MPILSAFSIKTNKRFRRAILFAISVGALAWSVIVASSATTSSAATFVTGAESESGSITGNAELLNDPAASGSGNNIVRFASSRQASPGNTVYAYRIFGGDDDPSRIGTANMTKYNIYLLSPYMVQTAQSIKQLNPKAETYMYKDATSTRNTAACTPAGNAIGQDWGVDYCDAVANHSNWFMTLNGSRFEYDGYSGHWHTDVGSSGYKERWADNVLEDLRKSPVWNGVFIDNMMADIKAYVPGGVFPDQYAANPAAQDAYARFMDYVGPRLKTAGFGTMGNNNGARLHPGLRDKYTNAATGGYDEFWTTFGGNVSSPNNLPLYDNVGWEAQIAEAELLSTQNKQGIFTVQTSGGVCTECRMYGYASYLLIADGKQAYNEGNVDSVSGDWLSSSPIYAWQMGAATSSRTQVQTNLFQRTYDKGLVLVNASNTADRTVVLPKPYLDESGKKVMSVTVDALRGRILRSMQ